MVVFFIYSCGLDLFLLLMMGEFGLSLFRLLLFGMDGIWGKVGELLMVFLVLFLGFWVG